MKSESDSVTEQGNAPVKPTLHQWQSAYGGTNSLNAGFSFPLNHGDTVTATKPIRANRYVKRGAVLTFRGLGFMVLLFTNAAGKWVKLQHADAKNLDFLCES